MTRKPVSRVRLSAHPEGFQIDPVLRRAFVNVPDAHQIAVADLITGTQIATWPTGSLRSNFPMAFEAGSKTLAAVFRSPATLALLDTSTGARRATIPTCGDADDVFFDAKRQRLYASCGSGSVDVFENTEAGYRPSFQIKTASGARAALFVADLNVLLVAARAGFSGLGSDAAILVFRAQP